MGAPTGVNTGLEAMLVSAMQGATRPGKHIVIAYPSQRTETHDKLLRALLLVFY